jgi:hypothetical protein
MLRMTDLESGKSIDITLPDVVAKCFLEQLDRGRKPSNRKAFLRRLEHRIQLAIGDSVDVSLQPPLQCEITEAAVIAMLHNVPIPQEGLRRRSILLKFLRPYASSPTACPEQPSPPE